MPLPKNFGSTSMACDANHPINALLSSDVFTLKAETPSASHSLNVVSTEPLTPTPYMYACDELSEALAPLKVWPTLADAHGSFSFSVLDLYGRVVYRSPRIRQVHYSKRESLRGTIHAARRALSAQGLGFPIWGIGIERPEACPEEAAALANPPCKGCRLMSCKH
jgi:hypothetical protein